MPAPDRQKMELPAPKPDARQDLPDLLQRGVQMLRRGDLDAAERLFLYARGLNQEIGDTHLNLGVCRLLRNDYDAAARHFHRALRCPGSHPLMRSDAWSNLSLCALRQSFPDEALKAAETSLEIRPDHRDARYHRALALEHLGRLGEALEALRSICEAHPGFMPAWRARADLCRRLSLLEETEVTLRQLIFLLGKNHPELHDRLRALIDVCLRQYKGDQVHAEMAVLLSREPDHPENLLLRVRQHVEAWEWEEAWQLGARWAKRDGNWALTMAFVAMNRHDHHAMVDLLRNAPDNADKMNIVWVSGWWQSDEHGWVEKTKQYLRAPHGEDRPETLASVHFRIGEYFHMHQQYASAFQHLQAGHWNMAIPQPFDMHKVRDAEKVILEKTGQIDAVPANDGPGICLVVGMPRSGTTLMEQILDMHRRIRGFGELFGANFAAQRLVSSCEIEAFREKIRAYQEEIAREADGAAWAIDKMPMNFQYLGPLLRAMPDARAIWMRRDPLDTCVSIFRRHFQGYHPYAHDLESLGRYYRWQERMMHGWMEMFPGRILEVQYESLVEDLEGVTRNALAWLGLAWDPACLDFHRNPRRVRTASRDQVNQPLYRSAIGSWRAYAPWLEPLRKGLAFPATV